MSKDNEEVNEEAFTVKLMELCNANATNKKPWSKAKVKEVIKELNEVKYLGSARKTRKQYHLSATYQVVEIAGVQQVICKQKSETDPMVIVIPLEDYYKTLLEIHRSVSHGGRDKMAQALKQRCHIPRSVVELFLTCCNTCNAKRTSRKFVLRPITSTDFNIRAQVDIIDLSTTPDKAYKFLMSYHDHFTRFCSLRPLMSREVPEVANELLKIFLEFGTPRILQSENGRKFSASLVNHISTSWPECKIVHGKHDRKTIKEVDKQVKTWMVDNNSFHWSLGCYHVQWKKNNTVNEEIGGRTPYKALFGRDSTNGLSSLACPDGLDEDAFNKISTEEQLEGILENKNEKRIVVMNKDNLDKTKGQVNLASAGVSNQEFVSMPMVCCVCNMETIGSHACSKCRKFVHFMCGQATNEFGSNVVLCTACQNEGKKDTGLTTFHWVNQ